MQKEVDGQVPLATAGVLATTPGRVRALVRYLNDEPGSAQLAVLDRPLDLFGQGHGP